MNLKEVLKEAILLLPDYLKKDIDFLSILENLYAFLDNILEEDCYLILDKERYGNVFFKDSGFVNGFSNSTIVMALSFQNEDFFFSFAIYDLNELGYAIDLMRSDFGNIVENSSIALTRNKKGSTFKSETSSFNDTEYFDYNVELIYFDSNHNPDKRKNVEDEKDEIFANKFFVPKGFARLLRLNFKRFRKHINEYRLKSIVENNRETEKIMGYLFCSPFRLGNLESFIRSDFVEGFDNNSEEVLYQVNDEGEEDFESFDPDIEIEDLSDIVIDADKLNIFLNMLAHYIDIDSIVVMSDTILNDLIDYISNEMIQSLNTTGVIIKKEGTDFIVYHVSINNNQFIIVPKVSTGEEIKDKYLKNPLNGNIKGLDEFLEINPRR